MTESKNNIEIVGSLRSLYPLQDFEEKAVMEVVERFEELTGKEELFDRNNKMFNELVCKIVKKTRAKAITEFSERLIKKLNDGGYFYSELIQLDEVVKEIEEIASQMKGEKE